MITCILRKIVRNKNKKTQYFWNKITCLSRCFTTTITSTFLPQTMNAVKDGSKLSKRVSPFGTREQRGWRMLSFNCHFMWPFLVSYTIPPCHMQRRRTIIWWQNITQTSGWTVNGGVATKQRSWRQVVMCMTHWGLVCIPSSILCF